MQNVKFDVRNRRMKIYLMRIFTSLSNLTSLQDSKDDLKGVGDT